MSQVQMIDTLPEWRESAEYWERHAQTIRTMFAPVTRALIEDAGIIEGDNVVDVAGGPGEPSLTIAEVVGPSGSITCTDAMDEMITSDQSEAMRGGVKNFYFVQCLTESFPFLYYSFHVEICMLGVMLFT